MRASSKNNLRKKITLLKQTLKRSLLLRESRAIVRHLARWSEYKKAKTILFYSPLDKEVQLQSLMRKALAQGKVICLPACNASRGTMKPYSIRSEKDLAMGPYGILEPKKISGRLMKRSRVELMLIPGIAFDARGNRLGRGKGYYDRFLKSWAGKAKTVGVALAEQVMPRVPAGKNDFPLQYLVHPAGIISCAIKEKS